MEYLKLKRISEIHFFLKELKNRKRITEQRIREFEDRSLRSVQSEELKRNSKSYVYLCDNMKMSNMYVSKISKGQKRATKTFEAVNKNFLNFIEDIKLQIQKDQ